MEASNIATILIIDDESVIRQTYADFLEDRDFNVLTAENGLTGLEILKEARPDLVLTDLRMPEMNGLEVLQRAREISPETPLIVISGTGQISDTIQALRLGAWDYILKPVEDMSIITHAVDQALEKARLLSENRDYQQNLEELVQERTHELQQANERLSDINTRLQRVVKTTRELATCSDIEGFGATLLGEFAEHMMASGGSLFLIEEGGLRLLNALDISHIPEFIPYPLPETSVFRRAIKTEKPLLIQNIHQEQKVSSSGWKGYKDSSALIFPLPDEMGRIIGILSLHSKLQPPFIEQDREIGSILASHGSETLRAVQSSEAVRESEERQRIILDSLRIGIMVIDPDNQTVVEANPEASKLIGLQKEQLIGSKCHDFNCCGAVSSCPFIEHHEKIDSQETLLRTAGETDIPIIKSVTSIQLNGRLHLLESFVDISKRKEIEKEKEALESQLIQAQKIEAVGILAGGLAHDLNNVLNGVFVPVSMLLNRLKQDKPLTDEMLDKQLTRIQYSGFRIADMVSQLMAVSYKQDLSLAPVDLNLSIKHVIKIAQNTFDKSVEIRPKLYQSPARTNADPTQIEQVLLNLAINASHSMTIMREVDENWGGKLSIVVDKIPSDSAFKKRYPDADDNDYWKLSVSDYGVGMDESILTQIFTPFFTTKQKGHGSGLGLSMVYNIIKQHGGFIDVESKPSVGSTFNVYLPEMTRNVEAVDAFGTDDGILMGEGVVLIVDDEEVSRSAAEEILKECGYQTVIVENGSQAVEIYEKKQQEIDLVLLDMVMPKMSGKETYARLKEINPDVKVLLVSGFKQDDRIQSILSMGEIGFMQKPYNLVEFSKAIKDLIN